jgi:hypothetical protein
MQGRFIFSSFILVRDMSKILGVLYSKMASDNIHVLSIKFCIEVLGPNACKIHLQFWPNIMGEKYSICHYLAHSRAIIYRKK